MKCAVVLTVGGILGAKNIKCVIIIANMLMSKKLHNRMLEARTRYSIDMQKETKQHIFVHNQLCS